MNQRRSFIKKTLTITSSLIGMPKSALAQFANFAFWQKKVPSIISNLWAWGDGNIFRTGLGSSADISAPVQVGVGLNWSSISTRDKHSVGVRSDGTLWVWGSGAEGRLGTGNSGTQSFPIQVGSLTNWSVVSAGVNHNLAVKTDGTLWSWGAGDYGKLGLGSKIDMSSPVQVGSLTNWSQVSAGLHLSLAIKNRWNTLGLGCRNKWRSWYRITGQLFFTCPSWRINQLEPSSSWLLALNGDKNRWYVMGLGARSQWNPRYK